MHKNEQKCAIYCEIEGIARNENIKNIFGFKKHFEIHPAVCEIQKRSSHLNRTTLYKLS